MLLTRADLATSQRRAADANFAAQRGASEPRARSGSRECAVGGCVCPRAGPGQHGQQSRHVRVLIFSLLQSAATGWLRHAWPNALSRCGPAEAAPLGFDLLDWGRARTPAPWAWAAERWKRWLSSLRRPAEGCAPGERPFAAHQPRNGVTRPRTRLRRWRPWRRQRPLRESLTPACGIPQRSDRRRARAR